MSSKSSQSAMVAQVSSNNTSASGNATRQGSRSSSICENSLSSTATRDRGVCSSNSMIIRALHPESNVGDGITASVNLQSAQQPVNLSSQPWETSRANCVSPHPQLAWAV